MNKRYSDIFGITTATKNIPIFNIKNRESDVYINYNMFNRLDLISNKYYETPDYWWIILFANGFAMEFDIEPGDIIRIPYPLEDVIREIKTQVVT